MKLYKVTFKTSEVIYVTGVYAIKEVIRNLDIDNIESVELVSDNVIIIE